MSDEVNSGQLLAFIERIEQVEGEIAELKADEKDIYAELKGNGFDAKIIRKIVALRKLDRDQRREEAEILAIYMASIGMSE